MAVTEQLMRLEGDWIAVNRLWMMPGDPPIESECVTVVALATNRKFMHIAYTWEHDGQQEGLLLIGKAAKTDAVTAAWVDSWHNGDRLMSCQGEVTEEGELSARGSYPAPSGPDWGWRIVIQADDDPDHWTLVMYNITPDDEEQLAVEARFTRVSPDD